MPTAMFQRRHYKAIAKILAKYRNTGRNLNPIVEDFITLFVIDNPYFDIQKFREALN